MALDTQYTLPATWCLAEPLRQMALNRCDRIYTDFFNLKETPFSITPDPEFLFLSETHRSVLEKIQYGIQTRMGFMLLTGEVGTGKTTICRALLDDLQDRVRTVYVINPSLSGRELLAGILDDLGIAYSPETPKKNLIGHLNQFLLNNENAVPVVIIVDDAQTMPLDTLEDLRLLSNLETDKNKLLQMLLVGQPELLTSLNKPQMRQLKQRVAISCRLDYLACEEVAGYIERRLHIAGNQGQVRFNSNGVKRIHKRSGGIPRLINKICDLALTAAYTENSHVVDIRHLKAAESELIEWQAQGRPNHKLLRWPLQRSALITAAVLFWITASAYGVLHLSRERVVYSSNDRMEGTQNQTHPDSADRISDRHFSSTASGDALPPISFSTGETKAYILQLASYNTLATTLRAVDFYTQKGVEVHWNEVQLGDKGLWYRVFAGRFAAIEAARQYQTAMGFADAQVLYAPWTVVLDKSGPAEHLAGIKEHLKTLSVDSFIVSGRDGFPTLCAGAYLSQARAEAVARKIQQRSGIGARAALFQPDGVSNQPVASALTMEGTS